MNSLGIQNNRFHRQAIENRTKNECSEYYYLNNVKKKQKNEYYEKWLKQREMQSNASTETYLDIITPNLPQAKIPNTFQVKLMNDILKENKQKMHY
ncbi:unnamed protein product (macronuclear) [Paramecium tetraurelia]|uniref:Uncharacterized protein n=1 Tax=Paramecium tetraurelia TaxID=5888 RepID=A0C2X1_PARTE|nr:uncharacterized protein GSPATT00034616001 [Paramecium tetraurelia]CAK65138.1 unnamed protein product [Paramecium tetraurelia]|eukprot:XP_001432535.1 hypothetical protein (macronuclear) [Paramecium tetraurelia strain d4-2]